MYKGMVFAEFRDTYERDMVVTLLRTAGFKNDGKQVWASHSKNIEKREGNGERQHACRDLRPRLVDLSVGRLLVQ